MSKKESHRQDLARLLDDFLKTGDEEATAEYLVSNSSLPSPRANLELAEAFAEVAEDCSIEHAEELWDLCLKLIDVSPDEAPVNSPREFLPFCGSCAIGVIGSVSPAFFKEALSRLQELADDPRWRIREAVAMGIQKLLARQSRNTLKELERWIKGNKWLVMRAVAAGVAEPALLRNELEKVKVREFQAHKKPVLYVHFEQEPEPERPHKKRSWFSNLLTLFSQ